MAAPKSDEPKGFASHQAFRASLDKAGYPALGTAPRAKVASSDEFDRMRAHLATLHEGVEVANSFVDPGGQIFDCVPIEQQPSLKRGSDRLPQPPSLLDITGIAARPAAERTVAAASGGDATDRFGNSTLCPPGHIPIRRVTLDEMTRFRTLEEFQNKGPARQSIENPSVPDADASNNHRYAYTQQDVDNFGAHNFMSVWSPTIGDKQIFSLAQHWYAAGADATHQTLEVGWQVYPAKYGHSQPVLFIFWTNDNYVTSRNYNLENPGFVQTNPAWRIGGALSPTSSDGGAQLEIQVTVYLHEGNWWLYLGGLAVDNVVGYFPTSIYNGGLMATSAGQILFGGETVCEQGGVWPGMGSGNFASTGWTHAAYQRDIFYFPTSGGAQYAALTGQSPSPTAYTQSVGTALPPWNIYFFFGGPGAADC